VVSTGAQRRDRLGFSTRRLRHLQFQPHPGRHLITIRKILITSIRLFATAWLLWALATRVDFGRATEIMGQASLPLLATTLVALLAANLFVSLRWHLILSAEVPSPGVGTLLKIIFVGLFFTSAAYWCWRRRRSRLALPQARHRIRGGDKEYSPRPRLRVSGAGRHLRSESAEPITDPPRSAAAEQRCGLCSVAGCSGCRCFCFLIACRWRCCVFGWLRPSPSCHGKAGACLRIPGDAAPYSACPLLRSGSLSSPSSWSQIVSAAGFR
jgi:hypothetical protein